MLWPNAILSAHPTDPKSRYMQIHKNQTEDVILLIENENHSRESATYAVCLLSVCLFVLCFHIIFRPRNISVTFQTTSFTRV